jgi:hypothetical protein
MQIQFTDAERSFADSAEGKSQIALARRDHQMREAHKGAFAQPWNDAREGEAIRRLAATSARQTVRGTAMMADMATNFAAEQAGAGKFAQTSRLNGWREGR